VQVTVYDREERDVVDLADQYYRRVDGVLQPQSDTSRYANSLKGTSRGVELMLQRKSPDALSGWIAYSFGRTRDKNGVTGETFASIDSRSGQVFEPLRSHVSHHPLDRRDAGVLSGNLILPWGAGSHPDAD
jgi:hypothetical protein